MIVFVNKKEFNVCDNCTLAVLLSDIEAVKTFGIAVAVNNEVVPAARWNDYYLKQNDSILIIKAAKGG